MAARKKRVAKKALPRPKQRIETQAPEFLDYYGDLETFYKVDPLRTLFTILAESEDEQTRFNAARELLSYRYAKLKPVESLLSPTLDTEDRPDGKPVEYRVIVVSGNEETQKDKEN